MGIFDNPMFVALNKSMDGLWKRQEAISDNLANYETPNYSRKVVSFEDQLRAALDADGGKSVVNKNIEDTYARTDIVRGQTMRTDGNNVDLEKESLEQARTTLEYAYSQRMLNDSFSRLRMAISEGRK